MVIVAHNTLDVFPRKANKTDYISYLRGLSADFKKYLKKCSLKISSEQMYERNSFALTTRMSSNTLDGWLGKRIKISTANK